MSECLPICVTTDVYFGLKRGLQNCLALFTKSHLIDMTFTITKIDCFTICD